MLVFKTSAFASAGLLFGRPEWVPRGAIELLSLEDDYRFQNGALSFEDDYHFRPSEDAFCQSPDFVVFHRCCSVACAIRL